MLYLDSLIMHTECSTCQHLHVTKLHHAVTVSPDEPRGLMPVNPDNTKRLAVSLSVELADRVARLAKDDRRSVSNWLANTIELAVEAAERMRAKRWAEEEKEGKA